MTSTTDLFNSGSLDPDTYQPKHFKWEVNGKVATAIPCSQSMKIASKPRPPMNSTKDGEG